MKKIRLVTSALRRNGFVNGLLGIYLFMALVEIIAEYNSSTFFVLITRPFLMPLLVMMYFIKRRKPHLIYIISLLFAWLSNIFLMFNDDRCLLIGSFFSLLFYIAISYLIFKTTKFSNPFFLIVCTIPFLLVYIFFINVSQELPTMVLYTTIIQSLFMIFLGGYSSSRYILHPNISNTYLFISITLFVVSQLVFILKSRISIHFFQPIQTVLYIFAQYFFYEYVVFEEKRRRYYEIRNAI